MLYTMVKHIAIRILRWRLKPTLPKISPRLYKILFNLSWKFFYYLKPSQLWIVVLALLNRTEFKKLVGLPSILILFSSIFSDDDSVESKLDSKAITARLMAHKFYEPENNWENFFWVVIVFAIIRRFFNFLFKILWIPFKIAMLYYTLKYFGFDFTNLFNILNNLSLGIIDWFYGKITDFLIFFFTEMIRILRNILTEIFWRLLFDNLFKLDFVNLTNSFRTHLLTMPFR